MTSDNESFFDEFLGNYSCLGESVHSTAYLAEHVSVGVNVVMQVVFVNNVLGKKVDLHTEVFVELHWCHQIEVFNVDGLALLVEMTLLESSLMVRRSAVGVPQSSG